MRVKPSRKENTWYLALFCTYRANSVYVVKVITSHLFCYNLSFHFFFILFYFFWCNLSHLIVGFILFPFFIWPALARYIKIQLTSSFLSFFFFLYLSTFLKTFISMRNTILQWPYAPSKEWRGWVSEWILSYNLMEQVDKCYQY